MKKCSVLLIMAVSCLVSVAGAEYLKYKDPKQPIAIRIKAFMKRTTLEEKICQMTQIDAKVASNEVIKKCIVNCWCVLSLCIDVSFFLAHLNVLLSYFYFSEHV
jgi:hypothetical protein